MTKLLTLLLIFFSYPALAKMKVAGLSISAEESDFNNKTGRITLTKNVQIIYKGNYLSCQKAVIDRKNKSITAYDKVVLQTLTTYAEADKLIYYYEKDRGTFFDAFIQSGQVVFQGNTIEKIGDNKYVAYQAQYTACKTCPPAWSFTGSEIVAELGGYANIKFPVLRIAGFPVFILPKLLVPLKSDRQSGFLVPTLEFSASGGATIAARYFWAISRSKDLTLTTKKYETRGWKALLEYRYILAPGSYGRLNTGYIRDRRFTKSLSSTEEKKNADRGYIDYEHYYKLPHNFVHRVQLRSISDLRYMRDFTDELTENGKSSLENKTSISKNTEKQHLSAEIGYNINMLKADPFSANDDAVHRFPDIRYSITEQRISDSDFLFRADLRYVNFSRGNFSYDDICDPQISNCNDGYSDPDQSRHVDNKHDGTFNPNTDLIRTGQRLDIKPTISYPIQIKKIFNILPSVTFRETQYDFNAAAENQPNSAVRRYLQTDVAVKTLFSHVYGDASDKKNAALKHEIEPVITYSERPWVQQPNHAFFGDFSSQPYSRSSEKLSDQDFFGINKVQFDYDDRLFNKKLMQFGITNRLIRRRSENGTTAYKNIVSLGLTQSYDFDEQSSTSPQPWSNIDAILNVRLDRFEVYSTTSYYPYAKISNNSTRLKIYNKLRNYLEFAYTQSFTIDEDNNYNFDQRTEVVSGGLGWSNKYIGLTGMLDYSAVTYKVQSWRYILKITPPGNCWGIQFNHWQQIGADPEYKINFSFDFGGSS